MGIATILFNNVEPFEQTVNKYPFNRRLHMKSLKTGQVVSEKTFKDYMILNMYVAQGQGHITAKGHNFDCN